MDSGDLAKIRAFVAGLLAEHDDRAAFGDGESLIKAGRLDFTRIEFDPQRFDTVAEIAGMVEESRR